MSKHRKGYLYKRNGIYQLEYSINGKRFKQSLKVTTKAEAEKERDKIMKPLEVASETEVLSAFNTRLNTKKSELQKLDREKHPPLTVEKAWNAYLKSKNRADIGSDTLNHYESQFRRLTKWLEANHPAIKLLKDITPDISADFMSFIDSKFSARTYNGYLIFLLHMFTVLKAPARIKVNPWSKEFIRRKKLGGKQVSRRELTVAELRKIIESTEGEFRRLLAIGIFTGLRLGDAATLKWNEVDLERGIIRRIPRKTANTSGKMVKIGIPQTLFEILNQVPQSKRSKYVLPKMADMYEKESSMLTNRIRKHFEDCGIETQIKKEGRRAATVAGFHSLRHTYVSLHAEAGTPQAIIRDLVGHGNVAMTEHYEHLSDDAVIHHAKSIPAIIGEPEVTITTEEKIKNISAKLKSMNSKNWKKIRDELLKTFT